MGKAQRDKGLRREREFANLMGGERVPLSGAAGGSYTGDVTVPYLGKVEVKARQSGFKEIYKWLGENDALAIKADGVNNYDRKPWLVVIRAEDLKQLLDEMDELKAKELGE